MGFFCQGPWISLCIVLCNRDHRQMWSARKVLIGFLQPVQVRLVHWGEVWDSLQANLSGADTLWETDKKCLAVSDFMVVLWWFKEKTNQPNKQNPKQITPQPNKKHYWKAIFPIPVKKSASFTSLHHNLYGCTNLVLVDLLLKHIFNQTRQRLRGSKC